MTTTSSVLRVRCVVLAAIVLSPQHVAEAQTPEPPPPRLVPATRPEAAKSNDYVLRTYEVGDLVMNVPDYPYSPASKPAMSGLKGGMGIGMRGMGMGMGGMGMGSGTMPAPKEPTGGQGASSALSRITMDDLKHVLIKLVASSTWAEVGGAGELQQLGTSLLVRQTAAVHQEIQDLLDQLRKGSGNRRTVAIDVRWLFLDSDDLDRLMPPSDDGRARIDRKVLAEYTRRPSSIRGLTNCFTGQLVYLVSGTRRNVVSSFIPVVGSLDRPEQRGAQLVSHRGGARFTFATQRDVSVFDSSKRSVGYQPVIEKLNFGALLEIRPTLIPGDRTAIVDLRSTVTVAGEPAADPREQPPMDPLAPTVDRVAVETQELATTLSVPLGEPMLAGGLTYVAPSVGSFDRKAGTDAEQPPEKPTETQQLYLILELR